MVRRTEDGHGGGRKAVDESDGEEGEEMMPPHVVAARRNTRSSSVVEAAEQMLKVRGRLRQRGARRTGVAAVGRPRTRLTTPQQSRGRVTRKPRMERRRHGSASGDGPDRAAALEG
ncbi:uncharacterized protein C2845_PM03G18690 [Panicum miliaceum]|uniref:Uncharacterized protein n=1 Tax=Panicum miliaceum TaxID=4540 RepID=A0A3L6TB02_PANMI|nr:uncharacterized protein C2845_PM03G18690 [Panicum miliaceum]